MTEFYSEEQVIATVHRVTRAHLVAFARAEVIRPVQSERGPVYRPIDIARIELLCDLAEEFDLRDDALALVMALIDQVHEARLLRRTLTAAILRETPEVRDRLALALRGETDAP
jgi:chaperone modulatory protein CbpM